MKVFVRSLMVAVLVVMGLGLFSRTAIGKGISGGERWFGPMIQAGDISVGIGFRVARVVDEEGALDNQTSRSCSRDAGDLILVMMPDRRVAVVDSTVDDSREEW